MVNLLKYSPIVIITAAYPNFLPSRKAVCGVLMADPILYKSFLVFSIDECIGWPIILVVVFARSPLMVPSRIVIVSHNSLVIPGETKYRLCSVHVVFYRVLDKYLYSLVRT